MSKRLTAYSRAEKWYARQVKQSKLRASDYSMLARRMALCYEPATLIQNRNAVTKHDILSNAKELRRITDFKL